MQATASALPASDDEKFSVVRSIPFIAVHLMCLFAFYTGAALRDVLVCVGLYYFRMWAITAGYHRYFSHRAYKTNRVFQFLLAFFGTTSVQKGVLWWAAHHRHHHRESDQEADIHSPIQRGFLWSHMGWILCAKYNETRYENIRDFARFPELRWLNKYYLVPPVLLAIALYMIGGFSMLIWGFFISTTLLWHGTFTINSLSHVFGSRRYKTTDTSRNNWLLALITCGEGWHNNHHYHQNTANQGWFWWEVDLSYYALKALSVFGIVSDLRKPSDSIRYAHLKYTDADREALRNASTLFNAPAIRVRAAVKEVKDAIEAAKESAKPAPVPVLERS
ncbi:MAG: acyl-CoA desaturase [Myxococcaceae bacterium]